MQLYPVHPEECRACLIWAFEQSETEQDLVRNAAHILAELCIKGNLDVHAYLFQRQYMPEQAYGILDQCFDDLNQEPKNTAAKRLLLYTLQNCQEIPQHIVWQYCREPGPHDPDVLRLFVERCANRAEYALIHFFWNPEKKTALLGGKICTLFAPGPVRMQLRDMALPSMISASFRFCCWKQRLLCSKEKKLWTFLMKLSAAMSSRWKIFCGKPIDNIKTENIVCCA